jgi:arabinogalactan oligomer/maltooligosaccharide transport system permease protein
MRTSRATSVLRHAVLILVTLATIYPVLQVVGISLRPDDRLYSTSLALIPEGATLEAWREVLFEKPFFTWLRNSLLVSITVTLFSIVFAATAAYAFARVRFRGRQAGLMAFLVTQMFPATMLLLPTYVLMARLKLINTPVGLVIAYVATALPFCVWTMKGFYETIPRELEEAALIDGLTPFQAFLRIVLPLSTPALAITALFSFMAGWSEYIVARVVISSKGLYTLPLGLADMAGTFQTEWANYAAGSLLVCLPVVTLFILLNRFLVGGLTLGGVKG